MFVLGIQGSPRKKGNTGFLLSAFMDQARELGAITDVIEVAKKNVLPCKECLACEEKGLCPTDDDMKNKIYSLLWEADVIVTATPIFFYNTPAQLKAFIDRCQTLWARKYKLKLEDPGRKWRRGFLLAVGAARGKNLFEGVHLTIKYFLDAIGASFEGSLSYRQIENKGDMEKHPTVLKDVKEAANGLLKPFVGRKKILFASRENACRSQMASAFAQYVAGDKIETISGGTHPANRIDPVMVKAMANKGIDMAFRKPKSLEFAISNIQPDIAITMGCGEECSFIPEVQRDDWDLMDPAGKPIEGMRDVCDQIEKRVAKLISQL
ncbi:MAG: NAD(P)H-dependent oxidoreductase [Desulfobacterales bacterium]|nr:NAD(P)H-dependent oxidoreductase [Desulfobacterales bacterium]